MHRRSTLVPTLLLLTATTGIIDAVSYLGLGHVLVANMTGNVVFLGFALVGATGFSIASFLVALGAFLLGALVGGRLAAALGADRRRWLVLAATAQTGLAAAAAIAVATGALTTTGNARLGVIALLAVGMGIQNATVRRLAVPDLTTTVLTLTLNRARRRLDAGRRWQPALGTSDRVSRGDAGRRRRGRRADAALECCHQHRGIRRVPGGGDRRPGPAGPTGRCTEPSRPAGSVRAERDRVTPGHATHTSTTS
jgi:uncharacterized membrane protein YoaK (UPF0700 family)